jgi:rhamnogalacturonyl hydrolase YesR
MGIDKGTSVTEKNNYPDKTLRNLQDSLKKVEQWVEKNDYKGYEPFDGLSSAFRPLTFKNLFLDRLLMQVVRQSPINLRPLLGIKPQDSTKGRGYMAGGYLILFKSTGDPTYKDKAVRCLEWLIQHKSPLYEDFSWANHFDFASRSGRYTKDESIIVWTSLIGQTFLEAFELLGKKEYLEVADSVCRWIMKVPREKTDQGTCLSYLADQRSFIHNSNMLGAVMLGRTGKILGNTAYLEVAVAAMQYSCERQLADGSWYYGEAANQRWIDNFHTGYNLASLKGYMESTGDNRYADHLKRGFLFFTDHFIEADGRPKYYHDRAYPIDSQCAAQAVETLASFSDYSDKALNLGIKVAEWWIERMQDKDGHYYYRQYPGGIKAKAPMLHWAQGTMYKALAMLISKINQPQ